MSVEVLRGREVPLGGPRALMVRRTLPHRERNFIGAWCFVDHYGPTPVSAETGMDLPPHPHTNLQTVSWLFEGRLEHRDSGGHEGLITDGGVQWMTAASGLIHSETPEQTEGRMDGFQLWLNLHSSDKMGPIGYRDIEDTEIPRAHAPGVAVRVIAGQALGVAGAMQRPRTEPVILDVQLEPGARFEQRLPETMNAFIYVHTGSVVVEGREARERRGPGREARWGDGEAVAVAAAAVWERALKAVLAARDAATERGGGRGRGGRGVSCYPIPGFQWREGEGTSRDSQADRTA